MAKSENLSKKILEFYNSLSINITLPDQITVLNPYKDKDIMKLITQFYKKFYNDTKPRAFIIGINPGRLGAGLTGIPFTDPIRLKTICNIDNPFPQKQELSAVFIYDVIERFGGVKKFYSKFYINSVSPLGFIKGTTNYNYYDDKKLFEALKPFIAATLKQQIALGLYTKKCICLGEGENYKFLNIINQEFKLFDEIIPVRHPRNIMQYHLKDKEAFIENYVKVLKECENQ